MRLRPFGATAPCDDTSLPETQSAPEAPPPEESTSGLRAYWALAALVIGLSLGALAGGLTESVRATALGVAGFIGTLWLNGTGSAVSLCSMFVAKNLVFNGTGQIAISAATIRDRDGDQASADLVESWSDLDGAIACSDLDRASAEVPRG